MLEEIRITQFAIIDRLELAFALGLNVITGETGAGKSIVIDAVEMLMGGKADPTMVRAGSEKATIEGTFAISEEILPLLRPILEREDLLHNEAPNSVVLTREIRSNGRSSARINGTTVNQSLLSEVGSYLVDIHGQSEHLSLLKATAHIDLLDRYAGVLPLRQSIGQWVHELGETRREIKSLTQNRDELARRADRLRHAIEEINAANLQIGEEDELKAERLRLANSEQLATLTGEASLLLDGGDDAGAAVDYLQQVAAILAKLAAIDPQLRDDSTFAESLADQVNELALTLRSYNDGVEYDPRRLDFIEERLELLNSLRRRYGATLADVLNYAEQAQRELSGIENSDERLIQLKGEEERLLRQIGTQAEKLSRKRQQAGEQLAKQIETELKDLRMASAHFSVQVAQAETLEGCYVGERRLYFNETGIDAVEFLLSANPGEPLLPLAKVASGGETARIMLAMKRALTLVDPTDTLIFDEIDQGIGGRLGTVVGEKLWNLTVKHQVIVVTHLAQIAGYADAHYRVEKRVINERTSTHILPLEGEGQRANELVAMLGTLGESAEQTARDLLAAANHYKREAADPPRLL
ncbi:MAG: DNA repair protein RecN [Phototrophicaceae bacterium]|jgi:DNA repair protein RecN (Recombination protein N)